jgi:deoxyribonuclease-4
MKLIGVHIDSSPENIIESITEAKKYGANLVQFFVNTSIKDKTIYSKIRNVLIENNMKCVVHASFTINLAQGWDSYTLSVQQLIDEIKLASVVGALEIVVHLGKQLNLSKEECINNMYTSLMHIHNETKNTDVKILLETSTGQGTELGYILEDLAIIYRKFSKHKKKEVVERFGLCLDTCHVFSAGYNFNNKKAIEIFFDNFNELIGIKEIKLVHLNDSKVPSGSKVDRHENIGRGFIGEKNLLIVANVFKKYEIPIILETSYPRIYEDLYLLLENKK